MPAISPFGWFHTIAALLAIPVGVYVLATHKVIEFRHPSARWYLLLVGIGAATSLAIYRHGGFSLAHALGVLTLVAIAVGYVAEKFQPVGQWSPYLQAAAYSGTFLFNMLPASAEALLRLPPAPSEPFITSLTDPLLQGIHGALLLAYLILLAWQFAWLRRQNSS